MPVGIPGESVKMLDHHNMRPAFLGAIFLPQPRKFRTVTKIKAGVVVCEQILPVNFQAVLDGCLMNMQQLAGQPGAALLGLT